VRNYFANNLKHLRIQTGMTQGELAKKMDKDYSTIGKWELGQRNPIMADIIKIADIFNVPVQSLVEKDLRFVNDDKDEFDILFDKNKDILTDDDKEYIKFIIEKRKREIDEELNKGGDY